MIEFIGLFDTACDYTLQFALALTCVLSHVFTNRCSVAASNGGRPLPLRFRTIPGLSFQILRAAVYNDWTAGVVWLADSPTYSVTHQPTQLISAGLTQ
jgi:hypothetical protein